MRIEIWDSSEEVRLIEGFGQSLAGDALLEAFHSSTQRTHYGSAAMVQVARQHLLGKLEILTNALCYKSYPDAPRIMLAPLAGGRLVARLDDVLAKRRSVRGFAESPVEMPAFAQLLLRALGRTRTVELFGGEGRNHYGTYPSAGGLFPIETYVITLRVQGVEPCIAHFQSVEGALEVLDDAPDAMSIEQCLGVPESLAASVAFVILQTAIFERSTVKYGNLGYRFALLEAGTMAQNLSLVGLALGLDSLNWGSCYDHRVHEILGLCGIDEVFLHCLLFGSHRES